MKDRSPIAVVILSIVTFGIYDLYWLVKTKEVLNKETKFHTPSIWILFVPFLLLVICYVGIIVSTVSTHGSLQTSQYGQAVSTPHTGLTIIFLIGSFLGGILTFIVSAFWFFRFSKAVNEYTKGKMSTAVTFLILWVIHLIGVALVQDAFNDMSGAGLDNNGAVPANAGAGTQNAGQFQNPTSQTATQPSNDPSGPNSNPKQGNLSS